MLARRDNGDRSGHAPTRPHVHGSVSPPTWSWGLCPPVPVTPQWPGTLFRTPLALCWWDIAWENPPKALGIGPTALPTSGRGSQLLRLLVCVGGGGGRVSEHNTS